MVAEAAPQSAHALRERVAQRVGARIVVEHVAFRNVFDADGAHITSANPRSMRRKYQSPPAMVRATSATLIPMLHAERAWLPPSRHQRKPSMMPVSGLRESRVR